MGKEIEIDEWSWYDYVLCLVLTVHCSCYPDFKKSRFLGVSFFSNVVGLLKLSLLWKK